MSEQELDTQQAQEHDATLASRQGYGLTMCLDWNRMLIHRKTLHALGDPERVRLLINPGTRHFCVQGCDEKEPCSFVVPRDMPPIPDPFYVHSKFLLGQICALMGWNPALSYRVFGKINTHTKVLDFDLNHFMEVKLNEFLEDDEVPEAFMTNYRSAVETVKEEAPPPASAAIPSVWQPPVAVPQPSKPLLRRFMGGLFDSVQLPDGKDEHDD